MKTKNFILSLVCSLLVVVLVAGCGGSKSRKKIDYEATRTLPSLEIPPDLSSIPPDAQTSRTGIPSGSATYSKYEAEQKEHGGPQVTGLLPQYDNVRLERAGGQQWLVVNESADRLWPRIRDFLDKYGLSIAKEQPAAGILETNWAENRVRAGTGFERFLGKLTGQGLGSGLRDKYRIRLERGEQPGTAEIYISHRGLESVETTEGDLTGTELEGRTLWRLRPTDPELEAEMLRLLMVHLGVTPTRAEAIITAKETPARAELIRDANGYPYLSLPDHRERAWRRVGLSLDRIGFTVEDRDRSKWTYYVRYIDPEEGIKKKKKKKKKKASEDNEYLVALKTTEDGTGTAVAVLDKNGLPKASKTSEQILSLLYEQLK